MSSTSMSTNPVKYKYKHVKGHIYETGKMFTPTNRGVDEEIIELFFSV